MNWTIFDYGVGNLHSLRKALVAAGATVQISSDPQAIEEASVAVLPGVGAFGAVMDALDPARDALFMRHATGAPILGVCIGMQAMYEESEEAPGVDGLNLLSGAVEKLPAGDWKIPHMGWSPIDVPADCDPLVDGLDGAHVYYVHSYGVRPGAHTLASTEYGRRFSAIERAGNTLAFQFHPEKSSTVGQTLLRRAVQSLEESA